MQPTRLRFGHSVSFGGCRGAERPSCVSTSPYTLPLTPHGWGAASSRLVIYVAAEAGNSIRQRVAAWKIEHPEAADLPCAIVPHVIDLCHAAAGDVDDLVAKIREKADCQRRREIETSAAK